MYQFHVVRRWWAYALMLAMAMIVSGCVYETSYDITCASDSECPEGAACVDGYCALSSAEADMTTSGVTRIEVSPSSVTIAVGETSTLTATAFDSDDQIVTDAQVVWNTRDFDVASVSGGVVSGKSVGSTTVVAAVGEVSATATVNVEVAIDRVEVTPATVSLGLGTTTTLTATAYDLGDQPIALTPEDFDWVSSDASVTVSGGVVIAAALGSATITATYMGFQGTAEVTVVDVEPVSMTLDPETERIRVGEALTIQAIVRDENDNIIRGRPVEWSYAPPLGGLSIPPGEPDTVVLTPQNPGTTVITAVLGDLMATASIEVYVPVLTSLAITPTDPTIAVDEVMQLMVIGRDEDNMTVTDPVVQWFTSDSGVATVDQATGELTGVGPGTATITAQNGGVMTTITVTVEFRLTAMSANDDYTCGLTPYGRAWCWGRGNEGQLGNDSTNDVSVPTRISSQLDFAQIETGQVHACARSGGDVYCWGDANNGRLGIIPVPTNTEVPNLVNMVQQFIQVSTFDDHTCVVDDQAAIYCWGENFGGKLAVFQAGDVTTPTKIADPAGEMNKTWKAVSVGGNHTCAIGMQDAIYCWGYNFEGEVGSGDRIQRNRPLLLDASSIGNPTFIAVYTGFEHTCALTSTNDAYCWGDNSHRQLGNGSNDSRATSPTAVAGGHKFLTLDAGREHTCGVTMAGELYCWGEVGDDRLGTADVADVNTPSLVSGVVSAAGVTAGYNHTCAITATDQPYCWGSDSEGQLGTNGGGNTGTPSVVWP